LESDDERECVVDLHGAVCGDCWYAGLYSYPDDDGLTDRRAELLVDVVDVILEGSGIDEKFLGVTLFALVPNTTEFMNAISFALNGNIALRCVSFSFLLSPLARG
jgi:hypothetical protein